MADSCVPMYYCGAIAPGWLNGRHPSVAEGAVQRQVCFSRYNRCCFASTYVTVRNCGGFYVYKLIPSPSCFIRYCGNGNGLLSLPPGRGTFVLSPPPPPSPLKPQHFTCNMEPLVRSFHDVFIRFNINICVKFERIFEVLDKSRNS